MKTICNISRFIGEIFVFVGKFGLFVYFVLRMLLISCSFVSAGARESQGDRFTKPVSPFTSISPLVSWITSWTIGLEARVIPW